MRLQGETLILRPFVAPDAPDLLRYAQDPAVTEPAGMRPLTDLAAAQHFIAGARAELAIVRAGQVIGQVGVYPRAGDPEGPDGTTREIGYALARPFWGQGLMTEALILVLRDLARHGITEVWAGVFPDNTRSVALLTRLGFAHRFTVPLAFSLTGGAPREEAYYSRKMKNENDVSEL
ncbi:GNAT family N-acetyltransferase [Lacticaseibacillus daqingensis]|uniref:GNAT family N-acetyltransferase n=1 Tax=Lacticaseibacillus daqingensis TaxID=2486014 RepID=UPI000F7AD0A1|nr:GNAT family N-acetyltransferase [Lacticaseibacillus daqingensis]